MLDCECLALVGPFERFRHRLIEILDECKDLRFQIFYGAEITSFEQFTNQDAEPDFHGELRSTPFIQEACLGV